MAKRKKTKIVIMRNTTVTKTKVIKGKSAKGKGKKAGSGKYIATYAGLKFKVATKKDGSLKILTFQDMNIERAGVWEEHRIIGKTYPKKEFIGAESPTVTMTIVVDQQFGYSPRSVMSKLDEYLRQGKADELKIGSHKFGANKWCVTGLSEAYNIVWQNGSISRATIDVTLSYYY